jgi:electron transfer flavoprotein alpha subunit
MAGVWVVLQHRDGKLHRMSWEAVTAAQRLGAALGEPVEAILLGADVGGLADEVAGCDLAGVRVLESPALAAYTPEAYVGVLAGLLGAEAPSFVLAPHTYQSCEFVPRLAQATGAALVPEVIGFEPGEDGPVFKRPILEGKLHARVRVRGAGTALATLQSGAFPADGRTLGRAPVTRAAATLPAGAPGREVLGTEQAASDTVDLTKAATIVAVGRGIGGADKMGAVEELAKLLGAEIGASRPVIDNGWLPRDRQIGSSGQTVAPKLYLALGISGAIQHLVGMKASGVVVAINKDPGAPIFTVADYGIVGDLHEVLPALTEAIRAAKG